MEDVNLLLKPGLWYYYKFSQKTHLIIASISFVTFFSMIIFAFVPLTQRIETSGYSTSDLQKTEVRFQADAILENFQPVMTEVRLLSLADYIFIVAGFFLFFSLHSIFFDKIKYYNNFRYIPLIGTFLTIISRTLDSLENFFVILTYSNPKDYPTFLLPLTSFTEEAKWMVVSIEYTTLGISFIIYLIAKAFPSILGGWQIGEQKTN